MKVGNKLVKSGRTDYHVHPDYSLDAESVKIKDYCHRALELGLMEICFTTHLEFNPLQREKSNFVFYKGKKHCVYERDWLDSYFREITQAQQEFKDDGLKVKAGIEVGYLRGLEKDIEEIIGQYPFDFVLGAIHYLNNTCIASKKYSSQYFSNRNLSSVRYDYFTILAETVKCGLFDCIAHVDLYQRYGSKYYGAEMSTMHRGVVEPIFKEMARRNMGLEINTSSLRRGLKEFHPAREMVYLAAKAGIKIFTVGSDAHALDELGDHIDDALTLLHDFNLYNHVFTRRRATPCLCK